MRLSKFDEKTVRITTDDGAQFDGEAIFNNAEYMLAEYGRDEDALQIDDFLFYKSDIKKVSLLEDGQLRLWESRPMHTMHLAPKPYQMADRGKKTIELRLNDEKRRRIDVGDVIRFENTADETDVLHVRVTALYPFDSFASLYRALPLEKCGYTEKELSTASPADMDVYYSPEEQCRWGVLGIQFEDFC